MTEKQIEKQVEKKPEYPKSPTGHSPHAFVHVTKSCEHKWDGPAVEFENGGSVTCSKCGKLASDDVW